jgi:hypothetical protein
MCMAISEDRRNNTTLYFSTVYVFGRVQNNKFSSLMKKMSRKEKQQSFIWIDLDMRSLECLFVLCLRGWNICSVILLDTYHHLRHLFYNQYWEQFFFLFFEQNLTPIHFSTSRWQILRVQWLRLCLTTWRASRMMEVQARMNLLVIHVHWLKGSDLLAHRMRIMY